MEQNSVNENQNPSQVASDKESQLTGLDGQPAEAFHVIDFIREEMDERDWSIWRLIRNMVPGASDEELGRVKLSLDVLALREPGIVLGVENAQQVGRAFGTSADFWLSLDKAWQDAQRAKSALRGHNSDDSLHGPASPSESSSVEGIARKVVHDLQLEGLLAVYDDKSLPKAISLITTVLSELAVERLEIQRALASSVLNDPTEDDEPPYSTTEMVNGILSLIKRKESLLSQVVELRAQLTSSEPWRLGVEAAEEVVNRRYREAVKDQTDCIAEGRDHAANIDAICASLLMDVSTAIRALLPVQTRKQD